MDELGESANGYSASPLGDQGDHKFRVTLTLPESADKSSSGHTLVVKTKDAGDITRE